MLERTFRPADSHPFSFRTLLIVTSLIGALPNPAAAQATGGIVESATSTTVRPRPTAAEMQTWLPARGPFTFPAPYNTRGVRLTNASDCAGATDCISQFASSGWRLMNNSSGSNFLYVGLTLDRTNGGLGPSLIRYDKTTGETTNLGPLFDAADDRSWTTTENWYFSGSHATTVYVAAGSQLQRYDILTRTTSVVFDIAAEFGEGTSVWYARSSRNDRAHSFLVFPADGSWPTQCGVYSEDTNSFTRVTARGTLHNCEIDRSGQWLLVKEDPTDSGQPDNRIIYVPLGTETTLLAADGAASMSDLGFGVMVGTDATSPLPNAIRTWSFGPLVSGPVVYHSLPDLPPSMTQISFAGARSASLDQQFACGGAVNRLDGPRANEIVCIRLDGSLATLVAAPVMTDLDAAGGGVNDDDIKQPYGTLDPTGEYFLWLSNTGGSRLDAFLVHVPAALFVDVPADIAAPAVAITSPAAGDVTGAVTLAVDASDNVGVTSVQFKLDGADLGGELVSAPFSANWNSSSVTNGLHILTAVARDAAGNFTVSLPVVITVDNTATGPQLSSVMTWPVTENSATIWWTTDQNSTSEVEYGPTSAYGDTRSNRRLVTAHAVMLRHLKPGTKYYFRVRSRNAQGLVTTSEPATFTTLAPPPPTILRVMVLDASSTSAIVAWATDQHARGRVEFGTSAKYGQWTHMDDRGFIQVECLRNLKPGTTYHFRVHVVGRDGQKAVSRDYTFTTDAAKRGRR
jgi:hypothetical protein